MQYQVGPGDVLAVLGSTGLLSKGIRFFERLAGKPDEIDHVVIVTHSNRGRWLGISGQPGGVGICDVTKYLDDKVTLGNHAQPKPNDGGQLKTFLASCAASLGLAYDWVGFAADAADDLHLHVLAREFERLWRWPTESNLLPGHVVCSSLAASLYESVGWPHPNIGSERTCQPGDWWKWNNNQEWLK